MLELWCCHCRCWIADDWWVVWQRGCPRGGLTLVLIRAMLMLMLMPWTQITTTYIYQLYLRWGLRTPWERGFWPSVGGPTMRVLQVEELFFVEAKILNNLTITKLTFLLPSLYQHFTRAENVCWTWRRLRWDEFDSWEPCCTPLRHEGLPNNHTHHCGMKVSSQIIFLTVLEDPPK